MNYKWLLLVLSIFSGTVHAYQSSIQIIEQFDDVRLVAFIHASDLENYPLWKPISDAPPITVSNAIKAVQKFNEKNDDELVADKVKEIELRQIVHHDSYWHYLVKVEIDSDSATKYQIYIVLMTGKVIPAIIETESFK